MVSITGVSITGVSITGVSITGVSITGVSIILEKPNSEPIISNSSVPKETSILNVLLSKVV